MFTPKQFTNTAIFEKKTVRRSKMSILLDAYEMQLLDECCVFEPWLEDNIHRARKKMKGRLFKLTLEADERTDLLSALEASAQCAKELRRDDKSVDFLVLHDKIIVFTPDDFEIE